jgi:hypothetical protein
MSERERRANQGLRVLDEAHYSGRISRDEYRLRRRQLLGSLSDSYGITARNTLRGNQATAAMPPQMSAMPAAPVATASQAVIAWKPWLAFALGLAACAALVYWLVAAP